MSVVLVLLNATLLQTGTEMPEVSGHEHVLT
jgi:hypothetical protein